LPLESPASTATALEGAATLETTSSGNSPAWSPPTPASSTTAKPHLTCRVWPAVRKAIGLAWACRRSCLGRPGHRGHWPWCLRDPWAGRLSSGGDNLRKSAQAALCRLPLLTSEGGVAKSHQHRGAARGRSPTQRCSRCYYADSLRHSSATPGEAEDMQEVAAAAAGWAGQFANTASGRGLQSLQNWCARFGVWTPWKSYDGPTVQLPAPGRLGPARRLRTIGAIPKR